MNRPQFPYPLPSLDSQATKCPTWEQERVSVAHTPYLPLAIVFFDDYIPLYLSRQAPRGKEGGKEGGSPSEERSTADNRRATHPLLAPRQSKSTSIHDGSGFWTGSMPLPNTVLIRTAREKNTHARTHARPAGCPIKLLHYY